MGKGREQTKADQVQRARDELLRKCRELTQQASMVRQHTAAILGVELRREQMGDPWADEMVAYHKDRLKGYGVEL